MFHPHDFLWYVGAAKDREIAFCKVRQSRSWLYDRRTADRNAFAIQIRRKFMHHVITLLHAAARLECRKGIFLHVNGPKCPTRSRRGSLHECFYRFPIYEFIISVIERVDINGRFTRRAATAEDWEPNWGEVAYDKLFENCFFVISVLMACNACSGALFSQGRRKNIIGKTFMRTIFRWPSWKLAYSFNQNEKSIYIQKQTKILKNVLIYVSLRNN